METPKFNAVCLSFILFVVLPSLSALYECRNDGNKEQISSLEPMDEMKGVKLHVPPCAPFKCNTGKCWCCLTDPSGKAPCYYTEEDCLNNCPEPPPQAQPFP
uniref:Meg domain-containing protein n=1 Tax=Nelumbo nucifera TaxID=4432 RepID=A0A822ZG61_NELNU|nr:TPA_asm: hypothetical protein HUJ06_002097 [Nelumbo nucifera]